MSLLALRRFFKPSTCRNLAQSQRRLFGYVTKNPYKGPPTRAVEDLVKSQQVIGHELPPISEWRKHFPSTLSMHRVFIRNPVTADLIADSFVPEGSKDKVIIEGYPGGLRTQFSQIVANIALEGPGQLTRSLLRLPKERIKTIIVLEDDKIYVEYLRVRPSILLS